jgi:hypothetical protein
MKAFVAISFASFTVFALAPGNGDAQAVAGSNDVQSQKLICVLDKAAGVKYASNGATEQTAGAITFIEGHKKFVLTIKRIFRSQYERDLCRQNLAYWMPILSEKGTFDSSSPPFYMLGVGGKFFDYRFNIGNNCFASNEATIKFFDRDSAQRLVSYDLQPMTFTGLPGEWLELDGNNFEAGERLDLGPVVFTGKCERID